MTKTIWANSIVYNEDQFIWYSLMSILDFVDKILIYDTGSTDRTIEIIKELQKKYPQKIIFQEVGKVDSQKFSQIRQEMLERSKSDWALILDGDEVWPEDSIKEVTRTINEKGNKLDAIVTPFYNLLGDVYHYQPKSAGEYQIQGRRGHLTVRAFNKKIPGLHVENPYGSEGYFDGKSVPIQKRDPKRLLFINAPFLHFTHLKRSSKRQSISKFKYELGEAFPKNFKYPSVFNLPHPENVPPLWAKRSPSYTIRGLLREPIIFLWRKIKHI